MSPTPATAVGGDVWAGGSVRHRFDHAVVGAGLSGILLVRALLGRSDGVSGPAPSILLLDPRTQLPRTTFAYWHTTPTLLDGWAIGSWDSLDVVDPRGRQHRVALEGWRYTAVDWAAARAALLAEVVADHRVTFVPRPVDGIRDGAQSAAVRCDGHWTYADWVYDSRAPQTSARSGGLRQSFRGLWVETDADCVDERAATLLDFSVGSGSTLGFAYALPVSARSALVMSVRIGRSPEVPDPAAAVRRVVRGREWRSIGEESGITGLVSRPSSRRLGRRVLAIGVHGGRVRPSTGYAVTRIIADSDAIAASVQQHRHPFDLPPDPCWMRRLDDIWLRAVASEGAGLAPAFVELFTGAPVTSVLRFLEGSAHPTDLLRVVGALSPGPFVRAALRPRSR